MPIWRDVRCVLFDLDGTLIDSACDLGHTADLMRLDRGLDPLSPEAYRASAGSGARGMLRVAFGLAPGDASYDAYREEFLARYEQQMLRTTRPFDGVERLLARLDELGLAWGVVTNKYERFTLPLARALPCLAGARVIVCGDTTGYMKPHPASLREAMRRAGATPSHTLYVGDDDRDMQAGRAAGVRTVVARYGYLGVDARPEDWPADAAIGQPLELLKLIAAA